MGCGGRTGRVFKANTIKVDIMHSLGWETGHVQKENRQNQHIQRDYLGEFQLIFISYYPIYHLNAF